MDRDQEFDDPLVSGEHAGLEIALDPCPGGRVCAGLQFTQRVSDLQSNFVHHSEDMPPDGLVIFLVAHTLIALSPSAEGILLFLSLGL